MRRSSMINDDSASMAHHGRIHSRQTSTLLVATLASFAAWSCGGGRESGSASEPVELAVPAGAGSGQPHLAAGPSGEVVLSWLEPEGTEYVLRFSTFTGSGWSSARSVTAGANLFVNWADFPSVVPITADVWAAHWLVLAPDNFHAYNIMVSLSQDAGRTWGAPFQLHDDDTETEHGFVSLFPWNGAIGAVWLDGRYLADLDYDTLDPEADPIGVSLRYARLAYDGRFLDQGEIDALVCDCCQTDVAVAGGSPLLAYRDRTPDEIRDIAVRRVEDTGWSDPVHLGPDNWYLTGCPVNGPAIAAQGDAVAVAWFTGVDNQQKVRFAWSLDAGRSFAAPIDVDGAGAFGHMGVALLNDGDAIVSWWRSSTASPGLTLAVRRIARDGTLGAVLGAARSNSLRPIDVPQMVESQGELLLAWTDQEGAGQVRSVRLRPPR